MKRSVRKNFKILLILALAMITALTVVGCGNQEELKSEEKLEAEEKVDSIRFLEEGSDIYVAVKDAFVLSDLELEESDDKLVIDSNGDEVIVDLKGEKISLNGKDIEHSSELKEEDGIIYVSLEALNEILDGKTSLEDGEIVVKKEMDIKYSKGFTVEYLKGGVKKVVDGEDRTLILLPEGKEVPKAYAGEETINTPVTDLFAASTTQVSLLRPFDVYDTIRAVTSDLDTWQIEEMVEAMESGSCTYVGRGEATDYELLYSLSPDLAVVYTGPSGQYDIIEKLEELEIPYVVDNEYLEEDPFGRVEWMKLLAAFYNLEDEAEEYFNAMEANVEEIAEQVKDLDRPTVAWGMVYDGTVYVPTSDSYAAKMIEIAGGDYIFKDSDLETGQISVEEFYDKGKDADVFMYSSTAQYMPNLAALKEKEEVLVDFKAVKEENVWCFSPSYWQSMNETDVLINSLAKIFHPDVVDYEIEHYEPIED